MAAFHCYSGSAAFNKAVKLTVFPSLVYVAVATLPQHNQLQSCKLPRRYVNKEASLKFFSIFAILFLLVGCQTTVAEYNSPKAFSNEPNSVEVWMNDDSLNSAVLLNINGQEAWQRKSMQGAAMSVLLLKGENNLVIRMLYQEFMEFPVEKVLTINQTLDSQFKYVFVSKYDKDKKVFSYRFEKIDKNSVCKYGPTNLKRIITGSLSCSIKGKAYKFT
ncbi:hypothetical protein [Paraglaciecola sp.]|uniref:hypothetical protein n=1 Tax=Paraglaciecola sp. TaxID=1920173 RepID=UPI003EF21526